MSNQRDTPTLVTLVTGANKGIGLATARLLGLAGHTVLLGCRDKQRGTAAEKHLRESGVDAHALSLDVTDAESIGRATARIDESYGRLDVLINNAGISGAPMTPDETVADILRRVLDTNAVGVVAVTEAMLPLLRKAPAARIVNMSSEVGSITSTLQENGPMWQMPASLTYPVAKTALNMITAQYAKQLWNTPIKVSAANPGWCATDLNSNSGPRTPEQGAQVVAQLATLPAAAPSGQLWGFIWSDSGGYNGVLPW